MNIVNNIDYRNIVNFPDGKPLYISRHGQLKMNIHSMYCYLNEIEEVLLNMTISFGVN